MKVFSTRTRAERGSGAAETALRRFLARPAAAGIPKRHWRLAVKTGDRAEFVRGRLESENLLLWLGFAKRGDRWVSQGPLECVPSTFRKGNPAIQWTLHPDFPAPSPSDESIVVAIHEQACTGGRNPVRHLERPYVRYDKKAVLVIFWVERLEGAHTCPSNPIGQFRLQLPGPLGNRQLFDGETYPPRRVEFGEDPQELPPR